MRMNICAHTATLLTDRNGQKRLLIDVELHNNRGDKLYAVCCPNESDKPEPWQLVDLLTLRQLDFSMKVDTDSLPRGVRECSSQFEQHLMFKGDLSRMKAHILSHGDEGIKLLRHSRPKYGRKKPGKKKRYNTRHFGPTKWIKQSSFCEAVARSLQDPNIDLIPIVSRKGENFSIEYLLPVLLGTDWVGIVYHDNQSVEVLLDSYDIVNKAILCDPLFDAHGFQWFGNSFHKLEIEPDRPRHDMTKEVSSRIFNEASISTASTELNDHRGASPLNYSLTPPPTLSTSSGSDESWTPSPAHNMRNYAIAIQAVPVFVCPSTEELQCYLEYLLVNMEHNVAYYQQFRGWRPRGREE